MRKHLTLVFIALLFLTNSAISQKTNLDYVDLNWGKSYKMRKSTLDEIIAYKNEDIYALIKEYNGIIGAKLDLHIHKFDKEMLRTDIKELNIDTRDNDINYEFSLNLKDKLYIFTSYRDKSNKKRVLRLNEIDKKTLKIIGTTKTIATIDYKGFSRLKTGSYAMAISRDSTKVLVYYKLPNNRRDYEKYGFHVFNDDMQEIYNKEVVLSFREDRYLVKDYEIDNEGNVHILGKYFEKSNKILDFKKQKYTYMLLSYLIEGDQERKFTIKSEGKFLSEMKIALDNNIIYCAGFYSDFSDNRVKGSYFLKINADSREIISKSFQEFKIDFITQNVRTRKAKRMKKRAKRGRNLSMYEYDLDDIILRSDGGAVLVGEQFYIWQSTYIDANGVLHTNTYYNNNDIIVVNINPEGKIEWTEKVAKRQSTVNDGGFYNSYQLTVTNNKLYFIFNDNIKNLNYKSGDKIKESSFKKSKAIVTIVSIDMEGNKKRDLLYRTAKNRGLYLVPKVCKQVNFNQTIIFTKRRNKLKFGKITFLP